MSDKKHHPVQILALVFTAMLFAATDLRAEEMDLEDALQESSLLLQIGKPDKAIVFLKEQQAKFGARTEILNNLAIAHIGNNEPAKALSILKGIIDADPRMSIVVHNILEMELAAVGANTEQLNPILFVQAVDNAEAAALAAENSRLETSVTIQDPNQNEAVAANRALRENALTSVLKSWALAWSDKDYARYIAHYATTFKPRDGASWQQWASQRKDRLARPGDISVRVSNFKFVGSAAEPAVEFDQEYRSATYQDRTRKRVLFAKDGGRWKINSEKTIKTY